MCLLEHIHLLPEAWSWTNGLFSCKKDTKGWQRKVKEGSTQWTVCRTG